ncbi:hypothetical protein [Segatella copri]|uniref:hypothetical protein n=1 Tax=Segatella copri TaxID=165179 RepID=UPI001C455EDF|nr:hypothetical protein [Segatella copri]MBW0024257.1 hypothetical protein [Segatella copri]
METKINVAEILKDKPKGTKLYSSIFGKVTYVTICLENIKVLCPELYEGCERYFYNDGRFHSVGELVLFPSKEMRDWSKFAWKKGDILVNKDAKVHIIFDGFDDDTYKNFHGQYYLWEEGGSIVSFEEDENYMQTSDFNKANKEDAQEYIHKIEKELGGKFNMETLEIEKPQPEFKDGDIVTCKMTHGSSSIILVKRISSRKIYFHVYMINGEVHTQETEKDFYGYVDGVKIATDSEKQQLFEALAKKGKTWDAEKKAIVDLPKKCEFKAMDWCLMRDKKETWKLCQFSFFDDGDYEAPYNAVGGNWFDECIPYNEETKHLLGTTDEWKGSEG